MNVLRGDVARLQRCTAAVTGGNAEVSKQPNFLTNDHVATSANGQSYSLIQ